MKSDAQRQKCIEKTEKSKKNIGMQIEVLSKTNAQCQHQFQQNQKKYGTK